MDQSTKAPKARKRDPETKLAQHRLSVLELARELGNVAEAWRRRPASTGPASTSGSGGSRPKASRG